VLDVRGLHDITTSLKSLTRLVVSSRTRQPAAT